MYVGFIDELRYAARNDSWMLKIFVRKGLVWDMRMCWV